MPHSRIRTHVGSATLRVTKIFRIAKERYRNRLGKYDRINDVFCGVLNRAILLKRAGTF